MIGGNFASKGSTNRTEVRMLLQGKNRSIYLFPGKQMGVKRLASLALAAAIALGTSAVSAWAADHADVVDVNVKHQVIENFGASDCWTMQIAGKWSDENKNKIADLLFSQEKGIGLSLWRFNVGAGKQQVSISDPLRTAETFEVAEGKYDWTKQGPEQWFLKAAKDRGVGQFLAFANSPPLRMTKNGLSNSHEDHTSPTNLKPGYERQFAQYLTDILVHFRDDGVLNDPKYKIDFDFVSPVNEIQSPWNGGQEGCRMDNTTLRNLIRELHAALKTKGLKAEILTPEASNASDMIRPAAGPTTRYSAPAGDYMDDLIGDASIAPLLSNRICHHIYGSAEGESLLRYSQRLGEKIKQYPGWRVWMSEICILKPKRDLGITSGLEVAKMLHANLAIQGVTAWHWWLGFSTYDYKDGLVYTDWKKEGDPESVLESKMLWAMGNYSRFIRPGYVRVELTGEAHKFDDLVGSAYIHPDGSKLVAVYINSGDDEERVGLEVKGMEARIIKGWITSEDKSLTAMEGLKLGEKVSIPAKSVVTLILEK